MQKNFKADKKPQAGKSLSVQYVLYQLTHTYIHLCYGWLLTYVLYILT